MAAAWLAQSRNRCQWIVDPLAVAVYHVQADMIDKRAQEVHLGISWTAA